MEYAEITDRDMYMYNRGMMREYMKYHSLSPEEIHALMQWISPLHDVHENPWGLYNTEHRAQLDYVDALRLISSRKRTS